MIFLRQSTASQEIPLGRFVDSTNGNDEETGLTINNTDIKLWKTGATTLASKNSGGATHIANGEYYCVLDATDTDTIGPMKVAVHVAGALSVQVWCTVLDEAVYDVMFGTTAIATATNITAGTITTATNVTTVNGLAAGVITAASIAADAITDAKVASDVTIASVTGAVGSVTGNVGGNVTGSVGSVVGAVGSVTAAITLPTIPTAWITADGIATDAIGSAELAASAITEIQAGLSTLDAAGIRTAVGLASANLDTQIGTLATAANLATVAGYIDTEVAAIKAKTDNLPSDPADASDVAAAFSTVNSTLATIAGYIDTEIAALTTTIGVAGAGLTALATQASVNTIDDFLDTEIAAIKAKTDSLTFTTAGQVDANTLAIDSSTAAADRLQRSAETICTFTIGSGSTTTSLVTSAISPSPTVADQLAGRIVIFDRATTTAALRGQATSISASTSGGVLTVVALTTAAASGDVGVIV